MERYEDLHQTRMFSMATEFECQAMMFCFKTRFKNFKKGEAILNQGEYLEDVILIVKGSANVEHLDSMGNISIISQLKKGDVYGIESAYAGETTYKDSVVANEKSLVLYMNKHRVITPCENRCKRHEIVTKILMQMVAEGNIELLNKIRHMSKKTTRDKLMSYFSLMASKSNSEYFEIPFNKTELASYLSVDRSAMTTELGKMRDEGIIDYDKKRYRLISKKR